MPKKPFSTGWKKTLNELPDTCRTVQVVVGGLFQYYAMYCAGYWANRDEDWPPLEDVTHWREVTWPNPQDD